MLCALCARREASVFIEYTKGKKTEKKAYCEKCSKKQSEEGSTGYSFGFDFFFPEGTPQSSSSCSLCSSTLDDIARLGRMGCPECYRTFRPELAPALALLHGSAHHTGRTPILFSEKQMREKKIALLRAELSHAISIENYERCAEIRDEIKKLNEEAFF